MAFEATIKRHPGYVVLNITGDYGRHEHIAVSAAWKQTIVEEWDGRPNPVRLLVDMRNTTGPVTQGSGFRSFIENWGKAGTLRVAWLYSDPRNEARFLYREAVARQQGFFARSFRDPRRALRWLTEGSR